MKPKPPNHNRPTRDPVLIGIIVVCLGLYATLAYILVLTLRITP